jgi:hypothetical protein
MNPPCHFSKRRLPRRHPCMPVHPGIRRLACREDANSTAYDPSHRDLRPSAVAAMPTKCAPVTSRGSQAENRKYEQQDAPLSFSTTCQAGLHAWMVRSRAWRFLPWHTRSSRTFRCQFGGRIRCISAAPITIERMKQFAVTSCAAWLQSSVDLEGRKPSWLQPAFLLSRRRRRKYRGQSCRESDQVGR